jgi:hypothetical protein
MPAGDEVTVPAPLPDFVTLRLELTGTRVKVAATDRAALIVTWQEAVPVHAPLQPAKLETASAAAVRVTTAPVA